MRYVYSFLFYLALPFLFLRLMWRSRKAPAYRQRLLERLGFCPERADHTVWVNAVSLGETVAAIPLIKALRTQFRQHRMLVTNMTPTGSARVVHAFGESVMNCYVPYDLPDAVARFLDRVNPQVLVVMETELWPNLFAACKKRDIPVFVVNARMSERSAKGYSRIKFITRDMFSAVTILAAQTQKDADRFIEIGMPADRVKVVGNMKFDLELPADLTARSTELRESLGQDRLIWIAASTHPGEDEIILNAHQIISAQFPSALLILVPRHPERFDAVADLVTQRSFALVRRSQHQKCDKHTGVYLGDTMGEMLLLYAVSDVACVAGSFAGIGGHNVVEPAALRKPVITGPEVFNFADITAQMLEAEGLVKVGNVEQLARQVIELFGDRDLRVKMGDRAYEVVEKNRGSLQKQIDLISKSAW